MVEQLVPAFGALGGHAETASCDWAALHTLRCQVLLPAFVCLSLFCAVVVLVKVFEHAWEAWAETFQDLADHLIRCATSERDSAAGSSVAGSTWLPVRRRTMYFSYTTTKDTLFGLATLTCQMYT